jgi:hypothetical protein
MTLANTPQPLDIVSRHWVAVLAIASRTVAFARSR